MKYLITGLGNIGEEYRNTRHNIGFMVLERLMDRLGVFPESDRYATSAVAKFRGKQLICILPTTYMNLSGKAVRFHLDKHKIPPENLLVITDDIALPFGAVRIRPKGSDGGHNGLKSIQELLGNDNWARMRVGVGNDFPKGRQADFVLSPFPAEEQPLIPELLDTCADAIQSFAVAGLQQTMNTFNRNKGIGEVGK